MATKKEIAEIDNFKSTTELTSNPGFQSSLSIASKTVDEKPYNPFEHRNLEHPNSTIGSILHLLKACLGTGVLAMPAAFKNSGLAAGAIGTILSGLICVHTMHILVKVSQDVCVDAKKPSLSYAGTCGAAFAYGPKAARPWANFVKQLVDWSMTLAYLGVLCVYVVFIGSSFKEVIDFYFPEMLSIRACCALTLVPLVLICQIRNLKYLVPFSALANALVFVVFIITLYYIFIGLPSVKDRDLVAPVSQWPLFFSTVIFAMEGIGVIMPVENEMANPKRFLGCPGVLNVSMITVMTLYMVVGFFGYVQYGDNVKGSVTLNLPEEDIIAQVAKILMALVIFFTYALQLYVPMEMITRMRAGKESKYENLVQIVIRTTIVTGSVVVAVAFPNLELAISFVGAVFFSTLGLLFPAVIHTVYNWDNRLGRFNYILYKNIIIMIISVVALFSGAYATIASNVSESSENHANVTLT